MVTVKVLNFTWVAHVEARATCAKASVRSREEEEPLLGSLVGELMSF
jgi:hypothetical protein